MCDNSRECESRAARGFAGAGATTGRAPESLPDTTPTGPAPLSVRPGWTTDPGLRRVVAVPCELEGGLDAERSAHFGKAPGFAVVVLDDAGFVTRHTFVTNAPEGHRNGYAANALISIGVTDVVTAGIGAGMYRRLIGGGVRIWREQDAPTVSSAIDAFADGLVAPFFEGDANSGNRL